GHAEAEPARLTLAGNHRPQPELLGSALSAPGGTRQPEQRFRRLWLAGEERFKGADVIVVRGPDELVEGTVGVDTAALERGDAEAVFQAPSQGIEDVRSCRVVGDPNVSRREPEHEEDA